MKIIQAPENILSIKAKPVKKLSVDIQHLIDDMKVTLITTKDPEGVGLAAPQVGKSLQLFIIKPDKKSPFRIFINPEIVFKSEIKKARKKKIDNQKLEGCLSLKNIWGIVHRSSEVTLKYMDEKGLSHEDKFIDFIATIIQHEYDHLQGVLFPKRVLEQKERLFKSHYDEKGEEVFEPLEI